ncbi:MAG: enoyl-CoA hydratase/isomerase family protein [Roseobacter sp.]
MIEIERSAGVWMITLNRPEKANALTEQMLIELIDVMQQAQDARAVILTGRGKVFSAGADLDAARAGLATSPLWEDLSGAVAAIPGMTVAALNGTLAGGAFGMALACDLRIAVPDAKFFYPVMKLGFLPQPSDPGRLSALIGPARTKLILMGAQKLDTTQALSFGLIDHVTPKDNLIAQAELLTEATAAAPPQIAADIKKMCF